MAAATTPHDLTIFLAFAALNTVDPELELLDTVQIMADQNNWVLPEDVVQRFYNTVNRQFQFQETVKNVWGEFTKLEREFTLSLTDEDFDKFEKHHGWNRMQVAAHFRHNVDFLLTLKGIKPCSIIFLPHTPEYATGIVQEVLQPLFEKYHLESLGFTLRQVASEAQDVDNCGCIYNPRGSWIFADTASPLWPEVENIFFSAGLENLINEVETHAEYHCKLGKLLGYPVSYPKIRRERFKVVMFEDHTEFHTLNHMLEEKGGACCVHGLKLYVAPGDKENWLPIMTYYSRCAHAMLSVGHQLVIKSTDSVFAKFFNAYFDFQTGTVKPEAFNLDLDQIDTDNEDVSEAGGEDGTEGGNAEN